MFTAIFCNLLIRSLHWWLAGSAFSAPLGRGKVSYWREVSHSLPSGIVVSPWQAPMQSRLGALRRVGLEPDVDQGIQELFLWRLLYYLRPEPITGLADRAQHVPSPGEPCRHGDDALHRAPPSLAGSAP